jgi:hypothetical protein
MLQHLSKLKIAPIALILIAPCLQAKTLNKTFDVTPGGLLTIDADTGAIKVASHSKDTVLITVDIEGRDQDKLEVNFTNTANKVTIESNLESNNSNFFSNHSKIKVTYTVTLPQEFNADLDTNGGSISVEDLTGEIEAHTSGGSLLFSDIQGDIDIKTSGGSIKLDNVIGEINAKTSGGSIKAKFSTSPIKESVLKTSGGSITAYLPKGTAVNLTAKTSGGSVKSDFIVEGKNTKKNISGTINGGGPRLILNTSGGSVRVNKI